MKKDKRVKTTLKFLGAVGTVTGSKTLVSIDRRSFLVDSGLFQGLKELRLLNWHSLHIDPNAIEAVLLTHAHLDHSGYLPVLQKRGFHGKIYATQATAALCGLLLPDAAYLEQEDANFANKHGFSKHHPALPLFDATDVQRTLKLFEPVSWEKEHLLSPKISVHFKEAGHILGASIVQFNINGKLITFSGDLGRFHFNRTIRPPKTILKTDILILESTYGDKMHPKEDPKIFLERIIHEASAKGGSLLIPAFAVGRCQQLIYLIHELKTQKKIPDIPVFVNSPMATEATRIFCRFEAEQMLGEKRCLEMMQGVRFVSNVDESKQLNKPKQPVIIIAASGMATGGRVLHHLKYMAPDAKHTILFAGFQAPGTRGEALLKGAKQIKIHGEQIPVHAKVEYLEALSAHADQEELIHWLKFFKRPPRMTFLNHGEPKAREALKEKIEQELGWKVTLPNYLEEFEI